MGVMPLMAPPTPPPTELGSPAVVAPLVALTVMGVAQGGRVLSRIANLKKGDLPAMAFVTPLRYPGGKGRLGPWLAELLRANRISGGTYVEPYAGGAGAAIYLLSAGIVNRIIINDADFAVYAFESPRVP